MLRTPPLQRDKPAPHAPKRLVGRTRPHTEAKNNGEKTPCPPRARETGRSTSQSEDAQTKNNEKKGTVAAGTPIPPPRATPVIDPTSLNNVTEPYDGRETPIPETPLQHIEQITEENKTRLEELLKLLETAAEDLNKVNHRQVNTTIEIIKASIKKATTITQRMIIENEYENRFDKIDAKLDEIRKTVSEPPKTYAEVAQRGADRPTTSTARGRPAHPDPEVKARMEKLRRERAKMEVILTTRGASDEVKEKWANMSNEEITESLKQAIKNIGIEPTKIHKAQKITHGIKIRCTSDKEAEELYNIEWKDIFEGADVIEQWSKIVLHGVSKHAIDFERDKSEEIIALIEDANHGIKIGKVEPLTKRPRNPNAPTQSIIISMKHSEEADECITDGMNIERRWFRPERYTPQCRLNQCFNCQGYGHKANVCTRKTKCGKCAQEHDTRTCESEMMQCANCKDSHHAWHQECPNRQQRKEQIEREKDAISLL
jgi:hypothetical protein